MKLDKKLLAKRYLELYEMGTPYAKILAREFDVSVFHIYSMTSRAKIAVTKKLDNNECVAYHHYRKRALAKNKQPLTRTQYILTVYKKRAKNINNSIPSG